MKIPEGYESWREYLYDCIELEVIEPKEIAFGLCNWITEEDCEKFIRIYELYNEEDYE